MDNYEEKVESMLKRYRPIGPSTELKKRIFDSKGNRWKRTWLAVAASILLLLTSSVIWRILKMSTNLVEDEPTLANIQCRITKSGSAAQLLVSTDALAKQLGGEKTALQQYRYIVNTYPKLSIARDAMLRLNINNSERRLQK